MTNEILDIRSDSEVDDRIVSRMGDSLLSELMVLFNNDSHEDHSFESFCVRYMLETMNEMDHTNF
jgi:hypothetical protein